VLAPQRASPPQRPGSQDDVKDSEWICQLVQHGLVRPSFVPPVEIRRLRDLTRLRTAQGNERSRTIQRLEKVLQDAGIKLSSVASTTYSKSARAMLEALLCGVTDPDQLAELAKGKMRAKIPELKDALRSRFQIEHHGIMVAQLLAHIDTLDAAPQNLTERIEFVLVPHAEIVELLSTIPGVQARAAEVLIAECGLDMSVFPTVGHFASWAGACPGHNESAGRRRSGRTRPGPAWLTSQLTECARAAVRTKDTYLAAHYSQLRGRRGEQKRSGRSATTCSSPTSTLSATTSHTETSGPTGSASATQSSTAPDACSANSKPSATSSPSNKQTQPNNPPELTSNQARLPPTDRRHERQRPKTSRHSGDSQDSVPGDACAATLRGENPRRPPG
jgi:transposase